MIGVLHVNVQPVLSRVPYSVCRRVGASVCSVPVSRHVFSRVKECTLLQCFAYGCVGICCVSYFDRVRDYLLSAYIRCSLQIQGHLTASVATVL